MSKRGEHGRVSRLRRFFADGVWDVELSSLSAVHRVGIKGIRIVQLVFRGFVDDDCPLHAGALTFSSLMAIVPVLALSLALARGLGDAETAKHKIRQLVTDWTQGVSLPVVTNFAAAGIVATSANDGVTNGQAQAVTELSEEAGRVVDRAFEKVGNVSFKALGGVGLAFLVVMVIQVLGQVELSFNRVWGVAVGRSLWRKFSDYLSVLLVLPLLIIAASSLPVVELVARFSERSMSGTVLTLLHSPWITDITVVVLTSLSFSFLIMFMPNTRVRLLPGAAGGLVAALLFLGWIWLCKALQLGVAGYSRIYGSFAIVPILLLWVFVSWEIVLLGAEAAFAIQNVATFRMERGAKDASMKARLVLAGSVVLEAARAMVEANGYFSAAEFARERRVPVRLLNEIVDGLMQAGLLAELSGETGHYVLLKSPGALKVKEVLESILHTGVRPEHLGLATLDPVTQRAMDKLTAGVEASVGALTVEDLLKELRAKGS